MIVFKSIRLVKEKEKKNIAVESIETFIGF